MQTEDWDDYPVSGLSDGDGPEVLDRWEETSGDTRTPADSEEDWCDTDRDYDTDDCCDIGPCTTYRQPTTSAILKRQGIRAALNYKFERLCVGAFADMHRDAKQHGYTLARPGYKLPWWFKLVSRLEWYTRPKKKLK